MTDAESAGTETVPTGETLIETLGRTYDAVAAREAAAEPPAAAVPEGETFVETLARTYDEIAARDAAKDAPAADAAAGADDAPAHWSDADKARWRALAPEQRGWLAEMRATLEADADAKSKGVEAERARLARYDEVDRILAPYRETLERDGIGEVDAIRSLVETYGTLQRNPIGALTIIARSAGIDLPALMAEPTFAQAAQSAYLRELEARQRYLVGKLMEKRAAYSEAEWNGLAQVKDQAGQPAYPHLERLRARMQAEIAAMVPERLFGRSSREVLHEAYERAAWAEPAVREALIADKLAEAERAREAKRKDDVDRARRAGRPVASRAAPAVDAAPKSGSYKEELERVWDMLANR